MHIYDVNPSEIWWVGNDNIIKKMQKPFIKQQSNQTGVLTVLPQHQSNCRSAKFLLCSHWQCCWSRAPFRRDHFKQD